MLKVKQKTDSYRKHGKKIDYNNMPLKLGLAITTNREAMDRFVDMTDAEKEAFIEKNKDIMSKS